MSSLDHLQIRIAERLPALLETYDVPAAAWAVLVDGQVVDGAAGVLHRGTGVEATTDSVFQIGSITKLWTATLVMQLVDEGRVDLDEPIRSHLPDFRLADEHAAARVTVRQLLTHTAGFEGDIFTDTGVGDDCVEKYLGVLADVPQLFEPGERFSYNNAGYCVLGRLVEVLRGQSFDAALREHLVTPLGLTHVATGPYEAVMFRAAMGHLAAPQGGPCEPAPMWALVRSNAPAGAMLAMRPRDLIGFASMHLNDGRAADGSQVLASGTSARMLTPEVTLPALGLMGTSWGLGFERYDLPEGDIVGHDGSTVGQNAFLRIVPGDGVAVALLTNGGDAMALSSVFIGDILDQVASTRLPALPQPAATPPTIDASRFVGTYTASVYDLRVSQDEDQRIWLEQTPKGFVAEMSEQVTRTELVHYRDDMLIPLQADRGMHVPHAFLGDDGQGRAEYLYLGRAIRRADA